MQRLSCNNSRNCFDYKDIYEILCIFTKKTMSTVTVQITTRSKKAKYLLGLIEELSKSDKGIKIYDSPSPNAITLKAMDDAEKGNVKRSKSVNDLD
jgi:hypothetical protein